VKSDAFAPENVKPVIAIATALRFVIVTAWLAVPVPTFATGKVSEAGDALIAVRPLPESGTLRGLPAALSVMVTEALRAPSPAGLKTIVMVQLALLSTAAPHVFVCVKSPGSVPVTAIEVMLNDVVAKLVSVTVCDVLGFWKTWLPNESDGGDSTTVEAPSHWLASRIGLAPIATGTVGVMG
jgi:hypothetical protein